ncbi:hypothetical protein KR51_00000400 [Rubidibacter lacunae KORDI 51-2]|uniref:Uncharacterized protein n=1 Tax=Rubidibacter lacunae KORDI 51-2 TaxID=582515 RepID=U5DRB7_9CHRO|nr:hypothetical protein KR51_00000400 [Rubidibacter lacunae KORDI 51-2]
MLGCGWFKFSAWLGGGRAIAVVAYRMSARDRARQSTTAWESLDLRCRAFHQRHLSLRDNVRARTGRDRLLLARHAQAPATAMKKLGNIDAFARPIGDRRLGRCSDRESGYRQLVELCRLGEVDAARHLADKHPAWGFAIAGSEVVEREES